MTNKLFKDLVVGDRFNMNDEQYVKINEERINCCKVMNAIKESSNEKVMITPLQEVQVN